MKKLCVVLLILVIIFIFYKREFSSPTLMSNKNSSDREVVDNEKKEKLSKIQVQKQQAQTLVQKQHPIPDYEPEVNTYEKIQQLGDSSFEIEANKSSLELIKKWNRKFPDVATLPLWKRSRIIEKREERARILSLASTKAESNRDKSVAEQRALNMELDIQNLPKLKKLKYEEMNLYEMDIDELEFSQDALHEVQLKASTLGAQYSPEELTMLEYILTPSERREEEITHIVSREHLTKIYFQLSSYYRSPINPKISMDTNLLK